MFRKEQYLMKEFNRTLAGIIAAVSVMTAAASCAAVPKEEPETVPQQTEPAAAAPVEDVTEPEDTGLGIDGTILTWLGDFDLNPTDGGAKSVAISMFEDMYGAAVNCIQVDAENKYTRLSEMILSGEEVDIFPYDSAALPDGVARDQFEPLDPYFDIMGVNEGLWDDMQPAIDALTYNGSHYVMPYRITDPLILTYSRKTVNENGLSDPYTLYQNGEWDWDSFENMIAQFTGSAPEGTYRYGINGWFGHAILASAGSRVVNSDGSGLVNNINDPAIEQAENFMGRLAANGYYDRRDRYSFPTDGNTLFYAMGEWALGASNAKNPDADLMVVPFPKSPDSDKTYYACDYSAMMLVKNSSHPEAAAALMRCERLAASQPEYVAAAREKAVTPVTSGTGEVRSVVTEEQYDAIRSYIRDCTPWFDYGSGMGERMYGEGNYNFSTRGVMNNLSEAMLKGEIWDWYSLRDQMSPIIDSEIARIANGGQPVAEPEPEQPDEDAEEQPEENYDEDAQF